MDIQDIAKQVFAVLETGRQIPPFSTANPDFSLDEAYQVTAAVRAKREARGERPIGRKIGFTNRTIWAEYGVYAPIWGYVYDRTVRDLTGKPLEVSLNGLAEPRDRARDRVWPWRACPSLAWTSGRSSVASIGSPMASRSSSRSSRIGRFARRTPS